MSKFLILIYLTLALPLLCFNLSKVKQLAGCKSSQNELLILQKRIEAFSFLCKANNRVSSKFKKFNTNYLYENLEQMPLAHGKIQFIEKLKQKTSHYIEKSETLASQTEVDLTEIQAILKKIEGEDVVGKPHLIITNFSLKKNSHPDNITYSLNFKLLKREYTI